MTTLPTRDTFDLVTEIDADQQKLGLMDKELQEAVIALREAKYKVLVTQTTVNSIKDTIGIVKAQLIAKQSMLRSLPK